MTEIDVALTEVANIRAQLAASTQFQGFAPKFILITGFLSVAMALIMSVQVPDQINFIAIWAALLGACACIAVLEAILRARRLHGQMALIMLGVIFQKVLPFIGAGVVITWIICTFSKETVWVLPGLWQMLIGLLGFSVVTSLPREIAWAAAWYFLSGSVVLALAAQAGELSPWMMGIPLGVGQSVVAYILYRASREASRCEQA